jgi:hypothetical protein
MDKLEEHIRKNREDLDRYTPPEVIWKGISKKLNARTFSPRQWLSVAALIIVILGTAVIFFKPEYRWSDQKGQASKYDERAQYPPQLKETEVYYNNLVNTLYNQANPMLTKNPEIRKELNTDLSHLDSICVDLKKDLKDNVSNQEVVEALIQNYRIKIQILEDMLSVMKEKESNSETKKSHEL